MADAMYLIKSLKVLNLHPTLEEMIIELDAVAGPGLCTSAFRPGDAGVHGQMPCRGYDRRCHDAGVGNAIAQWINRRWDYDPDRDLQCCIFHKVNTHGWHLHIQCSSKTVRK